MDNLYFNPKKLRQIKNKRYCRNHKIWGWILTVLGGMSMLDGIAAVIAGGSIDNLFGALIFLIPGIALLWLGKRQVAKWDRYEALIDNQGNTSIKMLSEKMKLPEKTVIDDLYKMIGNDFFVGPNYNIEAYIDGERDMLVMAQGGKPMKPLPKVEVQPQPQQAQQTSEAGWHDAEQEDHWKQEPGIKVKLTDLEMIQKTIAETAEEDVRNSLYGIEGSLRRIDGRVQGDPELKKRKSIRNLYKYYLPQIMELIRRYKGEDTPDEIKEQIKEALNTSAGALANIEADLLEKEQMDIEVEIQVLENMFAQDGLLRKEMDAAAREDVSVSGEAPAAENRTAQQQPAQHVQQQGR